MGLGFQHGPGGEQGWTVAAGSAVSPGALGVWGGESLHSLHLSIYVYIWLVCLPSLPFFLFI